MSFKKDLLIILKLLTYYLDTLHNADRTIFAAALA